MNQNSNSVFYLYGFTRPDVAPAVAAHPPPQPGNGSASDPGVPRVIAPGIDEQHPPFLWRSGNAAALLSLVSRDEFCGPGAESKLQDLAWVGPRACRHQAVLEQTMRLAPVLPARFGTLFSSLEILGQFIERHRETIVQFLERVDGQEEWAVKGLLVRARAEEGLCRQKQAEGKDALASSPGLAYLQEQQLRLQVRQELENWLTVACNSLLSEVTPLASEARLRQMLPRETTGADEEMVLNWAFLVPQSAVPEFHKTIEHVRASHTLPGMAFVVSGPWPPYSFCPALEAVPV